jgi:hypothetical protein
MCNWGFFPTRMCRQFFIKFCSRTADDQALRHTVIVVILNRQPYGVMLVICVSGYVAKEYFDISI